MPKLHLVGITPDHKGLLLSEHARSKRGDLVLEIDDKLLDAIDRAHRLLIKEEGRGIESAALPSKRLDAFEGTSGARLSPREIQHRLRMGESVAALARSSGTDEAWIDRFAAPVLAEQARVVDRATSMLYTKPRVGPSAVPLGQAVAANVFDKGADLSAEELDEAWVAYMRPEGMWCLSFSFSFKGRRHLAEWDVDVATQELTARNKLAGELGYRESGRRVRAPEVVPAPPAARKRPPVKKTVVKKAAPPKVAGKPAAKPRAGARPVPQTLPGTGSETPSPAPSPASKAAAAPPAAPKAPAATTPKAPESP
ncbi:MAG: septation protein SepH, partial [Acidimicrobiia bacterium]